MSGDPPTLNGEAATKKPTVLKSMGKKKPQLNAQLLVWSENGIPRINKHMHEEMLKTKYCGRVLKGEGSSRGREAECLAEIMSHYKQWGLELFPYAQNFSEFIRVAENEMSVEASRAQVWNYRTAHLVNEGELGPQRERTSDAEPNPSDENREANVSGSPEKQREATRKQASPSRSSPPYVSSPKDYNPDEDDFDGGVMDDEEF